jgi:hypothetical protein
MQQVEIVSPPLGEQEKRRYAVIYDRRQAVCKEIPSIAQGAHRPCLGVIPSLSPRTFRSTMAPSIPNEAAPIVLRVRTCRRLEGNLVPKL